MWLKWRTSRGCLQSVPDWKVVQCLLERPIRRLMYNPCWTMHKFVAGRDRGVETETEIGAKDNTFYTHLWEERGSGQLWKWFCTTWCEQWTKTTVKAVKKKTQVVCVCVTSEWVCDYNRARYIMVVGVEVWATSCLWTGKALLPPSV
jgi:hypothetical protein